MGQLQQSPKQLEKDLKRERILFNGVPLKFRQLMEKLTEAYELFCGGSADTVDDFLNTLLYSASRTCSVTVYWLRCIPPPFFRKGTRSTSIVSAAGETRGGEVRGEKGPRAPPPARR